GNDTEIALRSVRSLLANRAVVSAMQTEFITLVAQQYEELKRLDLAEAAYLRLRPAAKKDTLESAIVLASFYARHGRLESGLKLCEEFADRMPTALYARLVVDLVRNGKAGGPVCRRAEQWLRQCVERTSSIKDSGEVRLQIAGLYEYENRFEEAAAVYREILAANPTNPTALNNLAAIDAFSDDPEKKTAALKLSDLAISIDGPLPELLDTRAVVHINLGDPASAIDDLTQAVSEADRPYLWFHLAVAQLRSGAKREAAASWEKAKAAGVDAKSVHPLEASLLEELQREIASDRRNVSG
ncbi:MAG: tetratricopeptide repeat protein, partial [Planctomycetaceae bacterium]